MGRAEKFVITRYSVPQGLKLSLALVTDLHNCDYQQLLSALRSSHPDAILIAGDTLERHEEGEWSIEVMEKWQQLPGIKKNRFMWLLDRLTESNGLQTVEEEDRGIEFLKVASRIAPTYLSVGNHEWYFLPSDYQTFYDYNITLLDNDDTTVVMKSKGIRIGGLSTRYDMEWLNSFSEKSGVKILLCHHPEYYRYLIKDTTLDTFNLVVSGHYHGGQWRVFNRSVYVPRTGLFMKTARGQFGKMIISAGVANTTRFPRYGNPCELVMIEI